MTTRTFPDLPLCALLCALLAACSSDGLSREQKQKLLESYTETAQQYYQMGENDRAEGQALKGLELDPDNVRLKLIRAWSMQKRGRTEDVLGAERIFRELTGTDDFRATLGLGQALERKGVAYQESAARIRSGARVTEAASPSERADEFERRARVSWEESLTWFARTLELNKDNTDALGGSMRVTALLGQREQSLEWALRQLEVTRADAAFWRQRALRPEIDEREERRFRGLARNLENSEAATRLHAAGLLYELGRSAEALAQLEAGIELAPDRPELSSRRAQLLLELGRHDEAIAAIDAFIARSPLPYDHADIQRAWELRRSCERARRSSVGGR